jgi:hypothetical protein
MPDSISSDSMDSDDDSITAAVRDPHNPQDETITVHFFIMHTLVMYKSHLVSSFGSSHRGMRVDALKIV